MNKYIIRSREAGTPFSLQATLQGSEPDAGRCLAPLLRRPAEGGPNCWCQRFDFGLEVISLDTWSINASISYVNTYSVIFI